MPRRKPGRPAGSLYVRLSDALIVDYINKLIAKGLSVTSACRTFDARRVRHTSIPALRQRYYRAKRRKEAKYSKN